jgi:hypothetical protein
MATMQELFRFRMVRGVQATPPSNALDLVADVEAAKAPKGKKVDTHPTPSTEETIDPRTWSHWLAGFSNALSRRGDFLSPTEAEALLPSEWQKQTQASEWGAIRASLVSNLIAAMGTAAQGPDVKSAAIVEGLQRLLRVQDLLSTLAQQAKAKAEQSIVTSQDVESAVAYRPVVLPAELFAQPAIQLVRQPGVTDLYVVKDEWNRYEAGELSQVINVLPGETFETRLRHLQKTETAVSTSTTQTSTEEDSTEQTQSSTLAQSSTKDASLNVGVKGQVEASAKYGPAEIKTSLGAQLQSSQSTSDSTASTTAYETVARALKTVSQTVIEVQSSRTVVSDHTMDDHKLQNTGTEVTVGLYRWLTEIHRVQLERYPNRYVLEFELPEPGAWLRWALENQPAPELDNPDPGAFRIPGATRDLAPSDINPQGPAGGNGTTYTQLASLWQVTGLTPPPPAKLTLGVALKGEPDSPGNNLVMVGSENATIPTGYEAISWTAEVVAIRDDKDTKRGTYVTVSVGSMFETTAPSTTEEPVWIISEALTGFAGPVSTGTVPISIYASAVYGYTVNITIECVLMAEAYEAWQESTFDQVFGAYQAQLSAYQQERNAAKQQPGAVAGIASSPELDQARAEAELRRLVIEQLLGSTFDGEPAIEDDASSSPPEEPRVNLTESREVATTVQFFEQAFEWENLVYVLYPYYWARRTQWATNATSTSSDPDLDAFLNAGSARVVLPARPGFENLVNYYLYTGKVWGGMQPPAPNDPDYLSVAAEIQSIEQGATEGTPTGSSWEISVPTTLLWAGEDPAKLPTNPEPKIPPPTPTT